MESNVIPNIIAPRLDSISSMITKYNHWISWNMEYDSVRERWKKIPINPHNGMFAKTNDHNTWGNFEEALEYYNKKKDSKAGGIGYVFTKDDGLIGIDLDHCIVNGTLLPEFEHIVESFRGTYIERSVSGEGLHIITKANAPFDGARKKNGNIEMFSHTSFFTITGDLFGGEEASGDIITMQDEVDALYAEVFAKRDEAKQSLRAVPTSVNFAETRTCHLNDDSELMKIMFRAKNGEKVKQLWLGDTSGYPSFSEADLAITNCLAFYTGKDAARMDTLFRSSKLYRADKWDRDAGGGETYGQRTIRVAIEDTKDVYSGKQPEHHGRAQAGREEFLARIKSVTDPTGSGFVELTETILGEVAKSNLPQTQVECLLKEIATRSKAPIKALREDLQKIKKQHDAIEKDAQHQQAAIAVLESYGEGNIIYCRSTFWVWDG